MTDRVDLTAAEREALAEAGGTTIECRCEFCLNTEAAVESIVAARVAELTAERDRLRVDTNINADEVERQRGLLDLARAELSAANARCAELRGEHGGGSFWSQAEWSDWSNRLASFLPEEYDGDEAQEAIIERALTDLVAERDALQATLDRVGAFIETWSQPHSCAKNNTAQCVPCRMLRDLRAALTPEGTE